MSILDFNAEHEYRRSTYSSKNQEAYDDWHEWVMRLTPLEKGLPIPVYYIVATRFDIKI